jgi:hypothetical protein
MWSTWYSSLSSDEAVPSGRDQREDKRVRSSMCRREPVDVGNAGNHVGSLQSVGTSLDSSGEELSSRRGALAPLMLRSRFGHEA